MIRLALAVALLLVLTLAAPARAQCVGGSWSALGSGVGSSGLVKALVVLPSGEVIVGGSFNRGGGMINIARYNPTTGAWSALGGNTGIVYALAVLPGGDVIVGGSFLSAGGVPANGIARYNPTTGVWSALGTGVTGDLATVYALAVLPGGDVIAGGGFLAAGGLAFTSCIARVNPTTGAWSAMGGGTNGYVYALAVVPSGEVIVGGEFSFVPSGAANNIARYNPTSGVWSALGSGTSGDVYALAVLPGGGGDVIVGGSFSFAGGAAANRIARYNGGWSALGSGANADVNALAVLPGGDVIVGGDFTTAGGGAANRIARYNPTSGVWSALGTGMAGGITQEVDALAVLSGPGVEMIAGGFFTSAGGVPANSIARYNAGTLSIIAVQPQSIIGCPGGSATFTVSAFDLAGGVLTYQWRKDTVPINSSSALTASLVLTNVQAADVASYDCVITGPSPDLCGVTSTAATLSLATSPITTQPANQAVCAGTNVVFNVAAQGSGLTYRWTRALTGQGFLNISDGATFSGVTTPTLTIIQPTAGSANDLAQFRCRVTTSAGCGFNSQSATFDVAAAPIITVQPSPQTVCAGTPASFSITATGALTYQWRKDGVAIDTIANPSAATATLTFASAQAADAGSYDCIVSDNGTCGSPTSTAAALTVDAVTIITAQPAPVGVCAGSPASFSVTATGTGTLTYQWRKAGIAISAATNPSAVTATLSLTNVQAADAATYDCIVTSPTCGSVTSSGALLAVGAPVVTLQPTNQIICPGDNVVFTGAAVGSGVTYRWARALAGEGFLNLSDNATFQGTTTPTLTIVQPTAGGANDTARFRLRFFSACGNTDATIVTFDVLSGPPVITVPPVAQSTCPGGTAALSVTATGSPLAYQWRKDTIAIDSIANPTAATAMLTLSNVQPADAVTYDCIVTNACGSVTSSAATLTICVADTDDGTGTGACDGGVGIEDLLFYLGVYDAGTSRADVDDGTETGTPDGGVGIEDLLYYLQRFDAGC